ncbi:MAG: protoporphyrinogen oxidase [Ignavibacteriaceae bacterium]
MSTNKKIVILGAGITGLTTAYLLHKKGFDITVLEKNSEPGGSMESIWVDGNLFDRGPNSGLETTPLIGEIVKELNLKDEMLYGSKEADKRYILRNNQLHPLPMNPPALIKTKLFSARAKLRLFAEPLIGRSKDGYYQSVADFVKRRLGQEFLDYAINPFVAGVYAGDPEQLSVKSAFPKLYALEEKYGGLIIGTIKSIKERKRRAEKSKQDAKMFSFKNGMQSFPLALADALKGMVITNADVTSVEKQNSVYKVVYNHAGELKTIESPLIFSTVPAYTAASLFKKFDAKLAEHLNQVYYPPVLALYLVYNKKDIGHSLDGFGFLVPKKEKKSFLGALWSSVIFPNRTDPDKAAFTIFIGGSREPEIEKYDKELLIKKVKNEFHELMKIKAEPLLMAERFWHKAIPQYNIGYIEHERYFDQFEKNYPGIFLGGNYRGGISVGDCIKSSGEMALKINNA